MLTVEVRPQRTGHPYGYNYTHPVQAHQGGLSAIALEQERAHDPNAGEQGQKASDQAADGLDRVTTVQSLHEQTAQDQGHPESADDDADRQRDLTEAGASTHSLCPAIGLRRCGRAAAAGALRSRSGLQTNAGYMRLGPALVTARWAGGRAVRGAVIPGLRFSLVDIGSTRRSHQGWHPGFGDLWGLRR